MQVTCLPSGGGRNLGKTGDAGGGIGMTGQSLKCGWPVGEEKVKDYSSISSLDAWEDAGACNAEVFNLGTVAPKDP